MAEVIAHENTVARKWGIPEERKAKTLDLNARRKALGWSINTLAQTAGMYAPNLQQYLSLKRLGSTFTLSLIEQAIERGEGKKGAA